MTDAKQRLDKMLDDLKEERDELKVRVHLAKMEAADEWQKLNAQLSKLESKIKQLGGTTSDVSKDVWSATKLVGEEISKGFKKIAKRI